MENVVIFYERLVYFSAIWHNLWLFGIVYGRLVYFSQFGMFGRKNLATLIRWSIHENPNFRQKNFPQMLNNFPSQKLYIFYYPNFLNNNPRFYSISQFQV
jgi:hypothetical protein